MKVHTSHRSHRSHSSHGFVTPAFPREHHMSRILLIEDSATQAAQFVMMLQSAGFEVETADTLTAGLKRVKLGGIDSLLLDLNLPDSEGLATFQTAYSS